MQVVREKLVALEIPFVQHTTVRGSPKRQLLVDRYGKFAVPYLEVRHASQQCDGLLLRHAPSSVFGCLATQQLRLAANLH